MAPITSLNTFFHDQTQAYDYLERAVETMSADLREAQDRLQHAFSIAMSVYATTTDYSKGWLRIRKSLECIWSRYIIVARLQNDVLDTRKKQRVRISVFAPLLQPN
jgi:hypothetical protein